MDMVNTEMGGSLAEQVSKMNNQDAFEESSGPIIYMAHNRMPAVVEFKSTIIYVVYVSLILVLMLILPGVRRTKFKSFFCLLTLMTVGASILLAMEGSHWLTGHVSIQHLKYSAMQPGDSISGQLEVNIGLQSVNVSLSGLLDSSNSSSNEIGLEDALNDQYVMYNECFSWSSPERMIQEHRDALNRGLPYPILTVTEYLSHDADGFNWSRRLREAGHFTSMCLYAALLCWLLTAVSMCVLPSLLGVLMMITGILMMIAVGVYAMLIPSMESLAIRMLGGQLVEFGWGFNYMTTQVVGLLTIFSGLVLFVLQEHTDPGEQFTIMESERNASDRKALSLMTSKAATITEKPTASSRLINLVIGSPNANSSSQKTNSFHSSATNHSVIIPIGDIEQNFKPSTN